MKIVKEKDLNYDQVITVLKKGGLVIFPSETTYGIAADATNLKAIKKLNAYKLRPFGKPYSVLVTDQKMAKDYIKLNDSARKLYQNFLPGPMTIISQGLHKVASGVESETGTLGIRISSHPLANKIVKKFGKPITATSANASYQKRPYKISDILDNLSQKQKKLIDLIIQSISSLLFRACPCHIAGCISYVLIVCPPSFCLLLSLMISILELFL